jgi:hypothetical protein
MPVGPPTISEDETLPATTRVIPMRCFFNDVDPRRAWLRTTVAGGPVSGVDPADPKIRLADMTGDGLTDIVHLRNGNVAYWPNLGHGRFGTPVQMRTAPRLPDGFDPRRLLLRDVDGDGAADLVYVDQGRVLLWANRSGNAWSSQPVVITGTPAAVDTDSVQLTDLYGAGMAGLHLEGDSRRLVGARAAVASRGAPLQLWPLTRRCRARTLPQPIGRTWQIGGQPGSSGGRAGAE